MVRLEQVNEVVYLGSIFSRGGRYEMDAKRRIAAVNSALAALMRRQLSFTYGRTQCSEMWVLQKNNERKMKAVEMRSLRRICGVSLADLIRNDT